MNLKIKLILIIKNQLRKKIKKLKNFLNLMMIRELNKIIQMVIFNKLKKKQ